MSTGQTTLLDGFQATDVVLPRALSVHPAVVDTSAFISDLIMSTRTGRPSPLLIAMKVGVVRAFAAQHVWAEVPRIIAKLTDEGRVGGAAAEILWWTEYVPLVRIVDTGGLPRAPTAIAMYARDPTDVPSALVRDLLAPTVGLAQDADLVAVGLAHADWWAAAEASTAVSVAGGGAYLGTVLTVSLGHGVVAATRAIFRLLQQPWVQASLLAVGVGLGATYDLWRPAVDGKASQLRQHAGSARQAGEALAVEYGTKLQTAYELWDAAMAGAAGPTMTHEVARLLSSSQALTRREIAERLDPSASESQLRRTTHDLLEILQRCSAFVEVGHHRWQCGRAGADFGAGRLMSASDAPRHDLATLATPSFDSV